MINEFKGKYRWLSNFVGGVEQKYQAAKCENPEDSDRILLMTPGEAKREGKKVEIRSGWNNIKLKVMERLLRKKFAVGTEYALLLIATKDEEIIEGNFWGDRFWGQCPVGVGENNLGKLLMQIRADLQNKK